MSKRQAFTSAHTNSEARHEMTQLSTSGSDVDHRIGSDRVGGAAIVPLAALWVAFCVISVLIWCGWGEQGWPVGSFWWDELALSGAADAILKGFTPSVDFWSPFILPLYVKALAQCMVGLSGGYVLECLLQSLLILMLLTALLGRRRHAIWIYWLGAWAIAQVMLPFNIGSAVVDAGLGTVAFAGAYNRLGGALISLVVLMFAVRKDTSQDMYYCAWLAMVLAIAFLVKVTAFQCVALTSILFAVCVPSSRSLPLVLKTFLLAGMLLLPLLWASGMLGGYLLALKDLSAIRLELMRERTTITRLVLGEHRLELFLLIFLAVLAAVRGHLMRAPWAGLVTWYLLTVGCVVSYMLTNFGDNGFFPVLVVPCLLLTWQMRAAPRSGKVNVHMVGYADLVLRCAWLVVALGGVVYLGLCLYWGVSFLGRDRGAHAIHFQVKNEVLSRHQLIYQEDWDRRPPIWVPGVPLDMKSPATYASYVEGLDAALAFLAIKVPDRRESVYALDFPAYVFSMTGGYRIPRGTYPWMLFGHEVSLDHHPEAKQLFSDVDVLMISKCSLALKNRRYLPAMYRLEMERHWRQIGDLQCWSVWRRA